MLGEHLVEAEDAFDPHQGVELLTGVGKVLTQALVNADATGNQFVFEDLLEQGCAATTTGAGLGLLLERAKLATAVVDGAADRPFTDVVTGADGRAVRQGICPQGGCARHLRQNQCGRVGRQADAVLSVLQQRVVVAVVTDQHRPQHAFAAGIDDQATVGRIGFVDEPVATRTRRHAMGIADRTDIDTQQLELGRHVCTGKTGGVLTHQLTGNIARHAVARRYQAKYTAVPRRAFADGEDLCIAGATRAVDDHPTARGNVQTAAATQGILRTNPGGKHDQIGFQKLATVKIHPVAIIFARPY
ncbi:hypothetical protein D3C80_354090 [compost metagenome]